MGAIISLIISTVTVPVKLFRAIMTLFQLLWAALFIAIIVLIVMYWDDIKKKYDQIVGGIETLISTANNLESKINDLDAKIDGIAGTPT